MEFSREEHLKKIGFKKGCTPWNKGVHTGLKPTFGLKHSKGSLEKMSKNNSRYWKGKKFTDKHKKSLSENHADFKFEKSPMWKGDFASYSAMHDWVRNIKGRPMKCEICGDGGRKIYDWANKGHTYRRVADDYIRLCRPCHRQYDIKFNNYRGYATDSHDKKTEG